MRGKYGILGCPDEARVPGCPSMHRVGLLDITGPLQRPRMAEAPGYAGYPRCSGRSHSKTFLPPPLLAHPSLDKIDKAQLFGDILRSQRAVNSHGSTSDSARWNNSEVELPPENRNSFVISTCREGIAMHKLTKGAPTHIGPATLAPDIHGMQRQPVTSSSPT